MQALRTLNLLLGGFWLLLAAWLLGAEWLTGQPVMPLTLGGSTFSAGWLALLLAGYNLLRWWARRGSLRQEEARREAARHRDPTRRHRPAAEPPPLPDPNFQFTERPEQPPAGGGPPPAGG